MIAQRDMVFSTPKGKVSIPKGAPLNPATPEQLERCKRSERVIYDYYTGTYKMVLIDLGNGEAGWVFPSDYDPKCKIKRKLTREQIETEMARVADKLKALYEKAWRMADDVTVTVTRTHGTNQKLDGGKGIYVAKLDGYRGPSYTATGTSELRALRNLDKQMVRESK
jgi:hypothetical protein